MNAPATLTRPQNGQPLVNTDDRSADRTGSIRDYNNLAEALGEWRARGTWNSCFKLADAAQTCGLPAGTVDVVAWATRRLATYRSMLASSALEVTAGKVGR